MTLFHSMSRAALVRPQGIATVEGDIQRTWRETEQRVVRIAAGLSRLGVSAGDRVAILAANSTGYYETLYALFALGAVAVPLNTRLAAPELAFQLADAGAAILVADGMALLMLDELHAAGATTLVSLDPAKPLPGAQADLEQLATCSAPIELPDIPSAALAAIFYTGGTTGLPKGVMHSHASLFATAANLIMQLQLDEDCVVLHSAPMFHLADFATFVVTMLAGRHVIIPTLDDVTILDAIERHGVTHSFTVPAVIDRIARSPDLGGRNLSSLKVLGYGGAPMPWGAFLNARKTLPDIEFVQGFGMTEMPSVTFLGARHHREGADPQRLRSAGQAGFGYTIRIVNRDGNEVPHGTTGEIVGRGDNVMLGYWNRPQETATTLKKGWLHSGDAGHMDDEGFVYITDRFKDMIVTGGENVYSIEVENMVSTHPSVLECAVVGLPDAKWGERVHAIVTLHPGAALDAEALVAHCRGQLAGYKIPRTLNIHQGPLPRSAAGKVLKRELRQTYASDE